MLDPYDIGGIILEIIFLAILGWWAWKQRGNKFVFWGMIAVIAMMAAAYVYFDWFLTSPGRR